MNVRALGPLEGRERGGSRPGLVESHITDIGSNVRFLYPMVLALGDNFSAYSDNFAGTSMAAAWTAATWTGTPALPAIYPGTLASVDFTLNEGEATLDTLAIDTSEDYTVEMLIVPSGGAYHGDYRIYLRMDNTTPDYTDEGVLVEMVMTGSGGTWTGTVTSYTSGSDTEVDTDTGTLSPAAAKPAWLSVVVSADVITVYWDGIEILTGSADPHAGLTKVGFGLECTVTGGVCLISTFRVQYYSTSTLDGSRVMLVASADGDLHREEFYGALTPAAVGTALDVRDDTLLTAAQNGQKLYIADYGDLRDTGTDGVVTGAVLDDAAGQGWDALNIETDNDVCVISNSQGGTVDGTYKIVSVHDTDGITLDSSPGNGTCAYRIERGPKVYDPSADTLTLHTASDGQVPTGCPLVVNYLDRVVLAGADIAPHVWYMSRKSDPDDWDYAQSDSNAAVAGTSTTAGMPGNAITALAVYSDDYLIIGCRDSLWRMRGDPGYGGVLDLLSNAVGILGANAWCAGPEGELVFLSSSGLYALAPGGNSAPIPLSVDVLPEEFNGIDPLTTTVSLEYDSVDRGIHIFLSPDSSNQRVHWWFDWGRKTFWPLTIESDYEPLCTCRLMSTAVEDSGVILGCRDGILRRFSGLAEADCGTTFTSYVNIGPVALAADGMFGSVLVMQATMASGSGDVTWSTHPATTFEETNTIGSVATGTWSEGLNASDYRAGRGQAFMLKITESSGRAWALENIVIDVVDSGRRRLA